MLPENDFGNVIKALGYFNGNLLTLLFSISFVHSDVVEKGFSLAKTKTSVSSSVKYFENLAHLLPPIPGYGGKTNEIISTCFFKALKIIF